MSTEAESVSEPSVGTQLRALVRQVIADHPGASVRELAEYVEKLTPKELVTDFYVEVLSCFVADVLRGDRNRALDGVTNPTGKNKSPKLEQRRKWWADLLASRVAVAGKSMRLGDCTVDDLQLCIDERRAHIAHVEGQILNYQKLIQLMTKNGARHVADLPEQSAWGES
ncbi:hypothetical protein [Mycobacterium sp. SMC-13]|uniref:hypothetical protein n=1 Tax=Mycobacterium sp. SMC-13 TaxID=3381626 RepID=UPI003876E269